MSGESEFVASASSNVLRELMSLLSGINGELADVALLLEAKYSDSRARRGCYLRECNGNFRPDGEKFYSFEAHLEIDVGHRSFSWFIEVNCTSTGWELYRSLNTYTPDGQTSTEDPVVSSNSFAQFAVICREALSEFYISIRSRDLNDGE